MHVPLTPRVAALINERILISRAPHDRTSKSRQATSISPCVCGVLKRERKRERERERERGGERERTESPRLQFKPVYVGIPSLWSRAPRIVRVDSESRLLRRFSTAPLPVLALCSGRAAFAHQQLEIIFPMYSRRLDIALWYKRPHRLAGETRACCFANS